jgi:hypothetical protein
MGFEAMREACESSGIPAALFIACLPAKSD